MDFRLELQVKPFAKKMSLTEPVMLIGSCFTDHISKKLAVHKFDTLENPFGILFNPKSIEKALKACISGTTYQENDLFYFNELWTSWDHHGMYSHPGRNEALALINESVTRTNTFLKRAEWVILTLGSSWVYELRNDTMGGHPGQVAANCHKVPQQHFDHRLLSSEEVAKSLAAIATLLKSVNPGMQIIFTVSPVRHHREGMIENNRSKALLITALHELIAHEENTYYFPSYELIIDDLRDYRFYAEDLVHPNYQATQYVWEKFMTACIEEATRRDMDDIMKIVHAKNHRPLHPLSVQHQQFLASMLLRTNLLRRRLPYLDFSEEISAFGG